MKSELDPNAPIVLEDSGEESDGFDIPDAATIQRAKDRRERLRGTHLAPEYISMHGGVGGLNLGEWVFACFHALSDLCFAALGSAALAQPH